MLSSWLDTGEGELARRALVAAGVQSARTVPLTPDASTTDPDLASPDPGVTVSYEGNGDGDRPALTALTSAGGQAVASALSAALSAWLSGPDSIELRARLLDIIGQLEHP